MHFFPQGGFISFTYYQQIIADVCWVPLLEVTVAQRAIDELVGCPLQGEVIPSLVERQVATQHLHVLLLPWETGEKKSEGHDVRRKVLTFEHETENS